MEFIEELVADGTTVLLTTQYMEEAEHLADQIVVIDTGTVIAHGTAEQLKAQLGGATLEARVGDPADLDRAARLLADVGHAEPRIDRDQRLVSIPTPGGTTLLLAAADGSRRSGSRSTTSASAAPRSTTCSSRSPAPPPRPTNPWRHADPTSRWRRDERRQPTTG